MHLKSVVPFCTRLKRVDLDKKVIDLEGAKLLLEYGNDLIISFYEKEDIIYEVIQQNSMAVVDKEAFDIFIEYIKGLPE